MKIITVINNQHNIGFNLLRLSCALHGLELVVLVSRQKDFTSNRIKDSLLSDYLENDIPDDEVVFFSDGIDAILMAREEEILSRFRETGVDILFSCESSCWPDTSLADRFPPSPTPYRYLNSGGFIGKAGVIRDLLAEEIEDPENWKKSNQYIWTKRYFKYPGIIGLDTACNIFQTFSPEVGKNHLPEGAYFDHLPYYRFMKQWFGSNFVVRDNRIFSKITHTWPCHAHFNGFSKCLMDYDIIDMVFSGIPSFRQPQFLFESD